MPRLQNAVNTILDVMQERKNWAKDSRVKQYAQKIGGAIHGYGELGRAKGLRAVNRAALKIIDAMDNPKRRMIGGWHAAKARAGILSVDAHDVAPAYIGYSNPQDSLKSMHDQLDYARTRGLPKRRRIVVMDDMPDRVRESLIDHATKNAYGERSDSYIDSDVTRLARRSDGGGITAFGYYHDIPQAIIDHGRRNKPDSLWSHIESKDLIDAHNKYKKIRNIGLLGATVGGLGGVALLMANRKKNKTPSSSGRVNKSMAKRATIQNIHESGRIHKMNTSRNKYFS